VYWSSSLVVRDSDIARIAEEYEGWGNMLKWCNRIFSEL
jgi:hypothetical protein